MLVINPKVNNKHNITVIFLLVYMFSHATRDKRARVFVRYIQIYDFMSLCMALTDTRTIAIGVIIGLIVGGGIGYMIPQSKINDLSMDKDSLEEVNGELLRSLENAGLDFDRVMFHVDELVEIKRTLEGEIDELNKEITKKNQYITELEAELNISNEENP